MLNYVSSKDNSNLNNIKQKFMKLKISHKLPRSIPLVFRIEQGKNISFNL